MAHDPTFATAQDLAARLLYRAISRREFLRRATAAGLSAGTISMILAACGGDDDDDGDTTPTAAAAASTPTAVPTAKPVLPSTPTPAAAASPSAAATTAATATSAPAPTATAADQPVQGGTLTIGMAAEPPGLDPGGLCPVNCHTLAMHMHDSLLAMDTDFNVHPWLATEWSLSDDQKGYIFKLRDDVTFHDGTPFNADAVKFTLDRIKLPETNSTSATAVLGPIYETTNVIDEHTVEVRFQEPYAPFLGGITTAFLGMVSPTAAQAAGPDFATKPVGSGPYIFKEWTLQQSATMTRNPDYNWAPAIFSHDGPGYLDEITYRFVPESATRQALLDTGDAQYIDTVPTQNVAAIEANADLQMLIGPRAGGPKMVDLNTKKAPLDSLEVRQALNYAFNRQELVDTLFQGVYEPASAPLSPNTFGYDPAVEGMYPYDVDKAAQLLDTAGWVMEGETRKKDGQEFRLNCLIGTSEEDNAIAQILQAQWKPLGIAVDINVIAGTALTTAKKAGEHHIGFKIAVYQDPDILGVYFHPRSIGGFNYTFYEGDDLATLLDQGIATLDPEERKKIYSQVQFLLMEKALLIPIYYLSNLVAAKASLHGVFHDTAGYFWLYDAWFKEG